MRTPDSTAIPTANQRPWFIQLDPLGDRSQYGMQWIWLYAYLYGQPPLDRPSDFLFNSLSRIDTAIYICVAGFVDYSLACSLHFSTWLLPLPFLEAIGSRNWFNTLLLLSFFVRARYSGLLEYLNDSKTSLRSAAGGIAETFPALYWHLFFSWRTNGKFTDTAEFSRPLPVKLDNRKWTQTFADIAQSSFRDALHDTVIRLLGPYILVIVVAVVAFILNGLYLLFDALLEPRLWAEITERATGWLQDMQSIIERDLAKMRSFLKWAERQLHKITVPAMLLFSDFVRMHTLLWTRVDSHRVDGTWASTSFLELALDLAKWAAPRRERRYFVVKRIDNYTTKTRLCYWPPVPALSAHNLRAAFNLAYGQTAYVCDILWRRHLPTQKRPYTDLHINQIRLLKLFPAQLDCQRLECNLDAYSLGVEAPRYLAISYRWSDEWSGSNRKTKPVVIVNGFRLAVRASTYEALRAVRSRWRTKMVWIDAVCINQKDDVEKGHQVKMMADIYAQSQKVVIWLGEPENARLAVRSLWGLWVRVKLWADTDDKNLIMYMYEHRAVAPSWFALKELIRREWFQRAWIAQEVAVASRAEIRYGSASLPWDVFASFVLTVSQTTSIRNLLSSDYNFESAQGNFFARAGAGFVVPWDYVGSLGLLIVPQALDFMKPAILFSNAKAPKSTQGAFGLQNTRVLLMLRALNQSGRRGSVDFFMRNLYRGRGTFESTQHRDRLYAVLSMSQERDLPEFQPDYGAPVTDIYTKAAAHCYRKGWHLLAESGRGYEYEKKHHACDFPADGSGCRCGNIGPLPSRVPNWAGLRFYNPLDIDAHESNHVGTVSMDCLVALTSDVQRSNYRATRASKFRALSVSSERLEIGGCQRIDVLEHCGARYGPAYVQRTAQDEPPNQPPNLRWNRWVYNENIPLNGPGCWWELASKLSPKYYPQIGTATGTAGGPSGSTTRLGAFWRTIFANRLGTIDLPEREIEGLFKEFAQNMRLMQQGIESPAAVLGSPRARYRHAMFAGPLTVCMGRRFGVTGRGLMGLFPWGARDGDEVWLMSGVTTPLLFRRCRHDGELLENIGECYVHGIMNGEAWDPLAATETVVLV